MEFIPYGKQYIDEEDINAVVDVLKSEWLTQGPKIHEFEDAVAKYHNCKYAVAFSNGTAALHGAYYSSGLKMGDEFITTSITFAATANAGLYCGGVPKFVDIDMNTYCIDIDKIEEVITDKTKVITPVSYAGYPVDISAIKNLPKVKQNNICVIHDACHAIGSRINQNEISTHADMTILSFHPVKHIACGEGGMVLTNSEELYKKLLLFRNHGITKDTNDYVRKDEGLWYHEMQDLGYNYRLTDIQCALGISQMKKLDRSLIERNKIAQIYEDELGDINWITLPPRFDKEWLNEINSSRFEKKPANLHSYHLYPILLHDSVNRKDFFNYLRDNNIGVQIHYIPIPMHPYYKNTYKVDKEKLKNSYSFYSKEISIPMYYSLKEEDVSYIIQKIISYNY